MPVIIESILANPEGADVAPGAGEFVQLRNTGADEVDVSGWEVADIAGHRLPLPAGTRIPPGETLRLHPGPGESDPGERIFFGYRAAVINNNRERLVLTDASGATVSTLGSGTDAFSFDYDIAWPTQLKLIYAGSSPGGFGLPTHTATVSLVGPGDHQHQLSGSFDGTSVILVDLPASMVPGWYDVHLEVRDPAGGTKEAVQGRLPFGTDTEAVLELVGPRNPPEWSFGEEVVIRVAQPVGMRLNDLGISPFNLSPTLVRTGVENDPPVTGFGPSQVAGDTIRLLLPPEPYEGYQRDRAQHTLNPGIPAHLLRVDLSTLPIIHVLPLPLEAAEVEAVLRGMFSVTPAAPELQPAQTPQWAIGAKPPEKIPIPPGISSRVFELVKHVIRDTGATVEMSCTLSAEPPPADETGFSGPWVSSVTASSPKPMAPRAASFDAKFGLLRPPIRRHKGSVADASGGFRARIAVTARLKGLPKPLPDSISTELEVPADAAIVQLPLLVPSLAVFSDKKYETELVAPGKRFLVLLDGMDDLLGSEVISTVADSSRTEVVLGALAKALDLLGTAIPELGKTFTDFPGVSALPPAGSDAKTGLSVIAEWLCKDGMEVTVTGFPAHGDIGAREFSGHPSWWDVPSAAFLIGLEAGSLGRRTLRAYAETDGNPSNSAYLDMAVPAGELAACAWTLHESIFRDGYGPRVPFRVITEPNPKEQWHDAEERDDRVNMPWFVPLGASYGNVINSYEWI